MTNPSNNDVAQWALTSYRGDAAFAVHGLPHVGSSLAGDLVESLRGFFVQQPFVRALQRAVSRAKGEVAVSIESQRVGRDLWAKDAHGFLTAMYIAHDGEPFDGYNPAVDAWVADHLPTEENPQ